MEQHTIEETSCFVSPEERAYLVRLCAAITGDRAVVSAYDTYEVLRIYRGD